MRAALRCAALLLACAWAGTGAEENAGESRPASNPSGFVADYALSRNGLPVAVTRVSLDLGANDGYLYRARTEPNALISLWREDLILEESIGRLHDGRPRPDHYFYQRISRDRSHSVVMDFEWERNRVRIGERPDNWYLDVTPGVLDKLVQQLALGNELTHGNTAPEFMVADGGKLKHYHFEPLDEEWVETPLGRLQTRKYERHKDGAASDYTLWLAPAMNHLPVRILRHHRGARYLLEIEAFESIE